MSSATSLAPPSIDVDLPWTLSPKVGLRPEPFGALAYHFDTRRLLFLKSNDLVDLVESLADHPSASSAIEAACETTSTSRRSFEIALASLAAANVIEPTSQRVETP